jgi:hypothetical protein
MGIFIHLATTHLEYAIGSVVGALAGVSILLLVRNYWLGVAYDKLDLENANLRTIVDGFHSEQTYPSARNQAPRLTVVRGGQ